MGFLGVPLDAGTVLVGSLAIGIAVDDTIHLATAFFRNASADDPQAALGHALRHVLPAVSYTTAIVGLGFLVLAFSDFTFVRNLGVLMTSVMAVCLLADVYLLPALLLSRRPRTTPDPVQ